MFEIKNSMKDRPLLHLTLRVERPVYFELKRRVKSAHSSTSHYLREMVHRELSTLVTYEQILLDNKKVNNSVTIEQKK